MHIDNIILGVFLFFIIGIFHPIVIKAEYYFSKKIWPVFFICGLFSITASLFIDGNIGRMIAVLGCTLFWCIKELYEQEERVKKGYFPAGKHHSAAEKHDEKSSVSAY